MHSQPFTAISSSSWQAGGLSTCVSHHDDYDGTKISIADDEALSLVDWDPEIDLLLPRRQRRHRVRIQGRLAIVRTVSVANPPRAKSGISTTAHRDEVGCGDEDYVAQHDEQFRGYGIGGAGNIRRPTDVMGAPPSASPSLLSLPFYTPTCMPRDPTKPDKWRWRIASLLRSLGSHQRRSSRDQESMGL
ncbi:hypothetical protein F5Y14DRAFT_401731 [Nemania sp. NC0429]|nr:hypothetical protein F5Y14DRAFT_401731 [Nemania sp. NC0429]